MKRLVIAILSITIISGIFLFIKRSIPYSDRAKLLSANISIDSIWSIAPATTIYDKNSQKYYWLKSLSSLDQTMPHTLKSRRADIRYMKFLMRPLENRIFRMKVDSVIVIDQVVERE
jgi:hypothetical protein